MSGANGGPRTHKHYTLNVVGMPIPFTFALEEDVGFEPTELVSQLSSFQNWRDRPLRQSSMVPSARIELAEALGLSQLAVPNCISHEGMAGDERIELPCAVLETVMLPLHQSPVARVTSASTN